ncbi:MAG: hypothetical protein IKU65_06955 [Oscillospiraceae bacterium]|nr:hypothetical protein [Oscillospiraceae bacterium]
MKKESIIPKIITLVLGVFLCAYIGYQAYRALYNPVSTVGAVYTEVDDVVEMSGYIIRDEKLLAKAPGSGVLELNMQEGERVASGSAVAVIYKDEASAGKNQQVASLSEQIDRISKLYSQSGESYDIDAANDKVSDAAIAIHTMVQEGVSNNSREMCEEFKMQTLVREYIYRDKSELLSVINELKKEKDRLGAQRAIIKRIYSPAAGYFSQYTDGYENVFTPDLVLNSTPSQYEETVGKYAVSDNSNIGKLISTNKWYFAATIDEQSAKRLKVGKEMTLKFRDKALPQVLGEVERISDPEGGRVLVVFSCTTHISDFTKIRNIKADAVIKTYKGLKVPREALRVSEDGKNGVYCLVDSQVKFKPVNIIFEKDSYYVSEYDSTDTKSLLLYDEIVVSAKNLENRKIIK